MLKTLVSLFVLLSAVGLVLSTIVHLSALLGLPAPLGERSWMLHMGVFVVWLAAVIVMDRTTREFKRKDLWRCGIARLSAMDATYGEGLDPDVADVFPDSESVNKALRAMAEIARARAVKAESK